MNLKYFLFILLAIAGPIAMAADQVVALVEISSATPIEGIGQPCDPSPNTICMSSWIGYDLNLKKVLSGVENRTTLRGAAIQHGMFAFDKGEVVLVVLIPIVDSGKRNQLKADYAIKDFIRPSYCFNKPLSQYGLAGDAVDTGTCYRASSIRQVEK